jgi:hypothetical protein
MAALHVATRLPEALAKARQGCRRCCRRRRRSLPNTQHKTTLCLPAKNFLLHAWLPMLQGMVVVDASGGWLQRWQGRQAALGSPLLRTPVTQHPHASPGALQAYADKQGRQQVGCVCMCSLVTPFPHCQATLVASRSGVAAGLFPIQAPDHPCAPCRARLALTWLRGPLTPHQHLPALFWCSAGAGACGQRLCASALAAAVF